MQVKILLEAGETEADAQEMLAKAMGAQRSGDTHQEEFHQALARQVTTKMQRAHQDTLKQIFKEIRVLIGKELVP